MPRGQGRDFRGRLLVGLGGPRFFRPKPKEAKAFERRGCGGICGSIVGMESLGPVLVRHPQMVPSKTTPKRSLKTFSNRSKQSNPQKKL